MEYCNIPHNRERIFLIGFLDREKALKFKFPKKVKLEKRILDFLEYEISEKYYYTEKSKIYEKLKEGIQKTIFENKIYQYRRYYVRENCSDVCPTLCQNMGSGGHNVPIINDGKGIRKLTPRECFNLQGFEKDYVFDDDISDSQLYKQAGNTVSVKIIKILADKIIDCFNK